MKKFINRLFRLLGYEIKKAHNSELAGSENRPIGNMASLLEDLKERGLTCKTILDVGANKTSWSKMAKRVFEDASFYLIEPQIEMQGYLDTFCKEFGNSEYFLVGAGAKEANLTLTIWDDLEGSSFIPKPNEKLKMNGKQRQVEIVTIDNLIETRRMNLPELIKLDIQGFELEALKGAKSTFGYTEAYIMEVSLFSSEEMQPMFSDVVNFMLARNYVVYDFPGFLRRPLDGALGQCDICFVKKEGFLRSSNSWS
jgi:FkbM family methyltransferase